MENRERVSLPEGLKNLRACLRCHLIKSADQFKKDGCNNCNFPKDCKYNTYTTKRFEGFLGITKPRDSWLAKWVNLTNLHPGMYCLKPFGTLSEYMLERARDTKDEE